MATERTGTDPDRTLDLLWRVQPQPSRGPKPGLSLDRIVQTTIAVADAEGLAAVSMRRIAEELGFTTMSLYRYVPGKGELLELAVDAAQGPLPQGLTHRDWRTDLTAWARGISAGYRAHPWVLDVPITHPPMGPNQVAWMDWALQAMDGLGLTGEDMLNVLMVLSGYLRGQLQMAATLSQAEATTGASEREWDAAYARMLGQVIADGRFPALAALVTSGMFEGEGDNALLDDLLEFGLARVLDGVAAYVDQRQSVSPT